MHGKNSRDAGMAFFFLNKVGGCRSSTLLKKRNWHGCFPFHVTKFLPIPFHKSWNIGQVALLINASVALILKPVKWFAQQLTGFYMWVTLTFNALI